jgi:hypothetical protein
MGRKWESLGRFFHARGEYLRTNGMAGAVRDLARVPDIAIGPFVSQEDTVRQTVYTRCLNSAWACEVLNSLYERVESVYQALSVSSFAAAAACYLEYFKPSNGKEYMFSPWYGAAVFFLLGFALLRATLCAARERGRLIASLKHKGIEF